MKKLFIMIVLIWMFSINTTYAYPHVFSDIEGDSSEQAVNLLSSYGIISGYPDNTFKPDKSVTRAEMAKIVTVAAGYYEYSKNMTSVYDDMEDHWAESYVELANVLNIVKGTSNNTYGPDNFIKFEEATTMIVRLLGYTDESLGGSWPSNYYAKAAELNLFNNINNRTGYASRRDISIMLYNALNCDLVKIKDNNSTYNTGKKLLSLIGTITTKEIQLDALKINDGFNYTNYLFNKWDVYYDLDGNAVYMDNPRFNEFTGNVTSILPNKVIFVTDSSGNVRAFQLSNIPIIYNGAIGNFESLENSKIKVVYEDDSYNGKVIGVISSGVTDVVLIDYNKLYTLGSRTFADKYLPVNTDSKVNYNKLYIYGDASSLEEIKENDLLYFYETDEPDSSKSALTIEVVRKHVQGVVTNYEIKNNIIYCTINNTVYKAGRNYIYTENASIKDTVNLVLDKDNNIVKLFITNYGKAPSTYGIVLNSSNGINNLATVRILDEYGNIKTYSLAENASVITKINSKYNVQYITDLKENDIVKFDPVIQGNLKIINVKPSKIISSYYNENTQTISNGYKITSNTFIVYKSDGKYQLLKPNQLDSYLEGIFIVNYNGNIEALYLNKGLKVNNTVDPYVPETSQSFDGTVYGIISGFTKIDDKTYKVSFFNNNNIFYISSTSGPGKNIAGYTNTYVRSIIVDNDIISLEKVTPETDEVKITAIYSNQFQIDGITYIEYSPNVKVYICNVNSLGNISSVKSGSRFDIQPGTKAQLYDIYGIFDGIIDVVLIFN
nr:S-layer homology domain-containing protein [Sedimentibacter sp.]